MKNRIDLIASAVTKIQGGTEFKVKMKRLAIKSRLKALANRKVSTEAFNAKIDAMDENYNCWTDGPQYLEKYYGDKVADAAKSDEWD